MRRLIIHWFHIMLISTITFTGYAHAQMPGKVVDDTLQAMHPRWVGELSETEVRKKKNGFFQKFGKVVFGAKPPVLIKPIAVIAENSNDYWIIDQKANTVIFKDHKKVHRLEIKNEEKNSLNSMVDMCRLPDGRLLITDSRLNKVFEIKDSDERAKIFGDSMTFSQPTGIAYAAKSKQIWVLETAKHRISVLTPEGKLVKTIGRRGSDKGEFNYPTHIWIDREGLVYIVDSMNFRVQIFDSEGHWVSEFGEAGDASGYLSRPKGIATDSQGNIYLVDALFHTIQIFDRHGHYLQNIGTQGREKGNFWLPGGIYIDSDDFLYVADSYNARVQIFELVKKDRDE